VQAGRGMWVKRISNRLPYLIVLSLLLIVLLLDLIDPVLYLIALAPDLIDPVSFLSE
jgi:hypothetical protein